MLPREPVRKRTVAPFCGLQRGPRGELLGGHLKRDGGADHLLLLRGRVRRDRRRRRGRRAAHGQHGEEPAGARTSRRSGGCDHEGIPCGLRALRGVLRPHRGHLPNRRRNLQSPVRAASPLHRLLIFGAVRRAGAGPAPGGGVDSPGGGTPVAARASGHHRPLRDGGAGASMLDLMRRRSIAAGVALLLALAAAGCGPLGSSEKPAREDGPGASLDRSEHRVAGRELFRGDFETGNLRQWDGFQEVANDRVRWSGSGRPGRLRGPLRGARRRQPDRLRRPGRGADGDRRARGLDRWYAWSTMFDPTFPVCDAWQVVTQWHARGPRRYRRPSPST